MTTLAEPDLPRATDGEIAAINLESARRRAWARFAQNERLPGVVEAVVDSERLAAQFVGDLDALDRLEALASQFARVDNSPRAALVQAEVASTVHRFSDARVRLSRATLMGGPREAIDRQSLTIDQACGVELDRVLAARRRIATESGRLEDLVPLGAVLTDLEHFAEADTVYRQALHLYDDVSPFPLAWVCFQLGMLWGELVPVPDPNRAALWYRRALAYLPSYVKARVHLAEIYASQKQTGDAEALLLPALSGHDPEVRWRLADVLIAQGRFEEAETQLDAARSGFEELLGRHLLAFADHAVEFYAGSGNDRRRALELARANVANRPTRRAVKQAHAIAVNADEAAAASELREACNAGVPRAIATYFADVDNAADRLPSVSAAVKHAMSFASAKVGQQFDPDARLYNAACASCHYIAGSAPLTARPDLALNSAVHLSDPSNLIQVILHGVSAEEGMSDVVMPAFGGALSDADVARIAAYLRRTRTSLPPWPDLPAKIATIRRQNGATN